MRTKTFGIANVGNSSSFNQPLSFDRTITPGGTTGNQTINRPAGSVNFASGTSSLVVTNSFITANSIVMAVVRTNDSTAKGVAAVPAAGSCTFFLNAAATAEVSIGWIVWN